MTERVFLGWDRPFLGLLVGWLVEYREELPGMTLVVPTAQAGRRVREALAVEGAYLAPRVVTPGQLLMPEGTAGRPLEVAAWVEALEGVADWSAFEAIFPDGPGAGEAPGWALSLARSMVDLERSLRENTLVIGVAAKWLSETIEADRWSALAELARRRDDVLRGWGIVGESRVLLDAPALEGRIVFAGVWDFPEALAKRLTGAEVSCLIAAPSSEIENFDAWGRPLLESWSEREIPWPEVGEVTLAAHARHQAQLAVSIVANEGTVSDALALGCADEETTGELVRAFDAAGWKVYNPGAVSGAGARAWLKAWRRFLQNAGAAEAIDLLSYSPTSALVGGKRAQRATAISKLRSDWLVRDGEDVARVGEMDARSLRAAELAKETLDRLIAWRGGFMRQTFPEAMDALLERVDAGGEWSGLREAIESVSVAVSRTKRSSTYWLDLVLGELKGATEEVMEGRVADVQGWLELLHVDGRHLVLCGLNEGRVPAPGSTNPWLGEGVRQRLGLITEAQRAARDAFVLRAVIEARRDKGRVDLLLAKSGGDGDSLLPSRLLLAAKGGELVHRVKALFAKVEPPDAGVAFEIDWKWQPSRREVRVKEDGSRSMSVSAFKDYLACPFRFYLKHGLGMRSGEPERVEWNARDFGNVAHEILETWGNDTEARDFNKVEALQSYFSDQVEKQLTRRFGMRIPLAARLQGESLKQRLGWFSRWQSLQHVDGWRVNEVEKSFEIQIAGVTVRGTVDRIDIRDGELRVLDYKTFAKLTGREVMPSHLTKVTASTCVPGHLKDVDESRIELMVGRAKKPSEYLWRDLQVPLYAVALGEVREMGYFVLGGSEGECGASWWGRFDEDQRDSAERCAEWVLDQVKSARFWPPAEKMKYDDFEGLAVGRKLEDLVKNPNEWSDGNSK